jgi:transcriptional regulator GlxA family with amidase domain
MIGAMAPSAGSFAGVRCEQRPTRLLLLELSESDEHGHMVGRVVAAWSSPRAVTHSRPRPVHRAITVMEADPARPFTVDDLAEAAGVSVRSLQQAFRRYTGRTPTEYLRDLRLTRAHRDLIEADPGVATVAGVAQRWGLTHLGRFAAAYRARFGVNPSTTLQDGTDLRRPSHR